MNRESELIKKAGNGTSSLTKLLLVMVVESCRSPLFTSRQQTLSATLKMGGCSHGIHSQEKNWKNNKTPGSVLCSSQPASSSDLSPFLFILHFFLFNVYIYFLFLSFLFVLYQATAHNNRNCSGGRKIEYKVVIYSRVWEKLRKI